MFLDWLCAIAVLVSLITFIGSLCRLTGLKTYFEDWSIPAHMKNRKLFYWLHLGNGIIFLLIGYAFHIFGLNNHIVPYFIRWILIAIFFFTHFAEPIYHHLSIKEVAN
ncbi:MAG: hypothetical protein PHT40_00310 [Patescibacteria group bacterium]|nr:hypothetical protein [Patescibacteria group bacterium]